MYQAVLSHFDFRNAKLIDRVAGGKGETEEQAILGAIGEAIEHYCASHPDPARILRATFADLKQPAIPPTQYVLYSQRQYSDPDFPYRHFHDHLTTSWIQATTLPDGEDLLVPTSQVFLSSTYETPEEYICPTSSNGLAAGPDVASAILSGLYEVVERDGFLVSWMNKLPAPQVDFSETPGICRSIRDHYHGFGIETLAFNMTTDLGIYVMLGMTIDRSGHGPAVVVGLGCSLNPVAALTKALLEVCQVRPGETMRYRRDPAGQRLQTYADVHSLEDHSGFFTDLSRIGELDFLLNNGRSQRISTLPNLAHGETRADLARCLSLLNRAGSQVAYVQLTTPDVEPFGIHVVRVLATELQPMHFGYGEERLGGRRLYEVAKTLGVSDHIRTEDELNLCPHPLA
jgi:ribosomal protein S12 methylthiotransferase accessory factor